MCLGSLLAVEGDVRLEVWFLFELYDVVDFSKLEALAQVIQKKFEVYDVVVFVCVRHEEFIGALEW